jgi:hypothetical protein
MARQPIRGQQHQHEPLHIPPAAPIPHLHYHHGHVAQNDEGDGIATLVHDLAVAATRDSNYEEVTFHNNVHLLPFRGN